MRTFEERLDAMEKIIADPDFRNNDGRANEVNYWVFDYPPNRELDVRNCIARMLHRNQKGYEGYRLVEFDIYNFIIDCLEKEGYLEATYDMEASDGLPIVIDSIFELLEFNDKGNWLVKHIAENTPDNAVVLLTGVGKAFPLLRSHKVLNNLSMAFRKVPVVLFFPGVYDERELRLFGVLKDDNYYRAFRMVK